MAKMILELSDELDRKVEFVKYHYGITSKTKSVLFMLEKLEVSNLDGVEQEGNRVSEADK